MTISSKIWNNSLNKLNFVCFYKINGKLIKKLGSGDNITFIVKLAGIVYSEIFCKIRDQNLVKCLKASCVILDGLLT